MVSFYQTIAIKGPFLNGFSRVLQVVLKKVKSIFVTPSITYRKFTLNPVRPKATLNA
jgi:hypothetical protein